MNEETVAGLPEAVNWEEQESLRRLRNDQRKLRMAESLQAFLPTKGRTKGEIDAYTAQVAEAHYKTLCGNEGYLEEILSEHAFILDEAFNYFLRNEDDDVPITDPSRQDKLAFALKLQAQAAWTISSLRYTSSKRERLNLDEERERNRSAEVMIKLRKKFGD